jgi:hypothetical protein
MMKQLGILQYSLLQNVWQHFSYSQALNMAASNYAADIQAIF